MRLSLSVLSALLAVCLLCACQTADRKPSDNKNAADSAASLFDDELDPVPAAPSPHAAPPSAFHRVLSLKAMDRILAGCPSVACEDTLFRSLGGITKVLGVAYDERAVDALIYGTVTAGHPPLHLDDLVIALRNAWLAYVQQKGNRILYLHPSLSLDPSASALKDLQKIGQDIARIDAAGGEKALERWKEACLRPYKVTVAGLPADSRFAGALLRADLALKAMATGAETPGLHGFPGMAELRKIRFQGASAQGGAATPPQPSLTRYWFHPGSQEWEMVEGLVVLKRSPIMLMTEEMYGRLQASDTASAPPGDELAEAFAYGFTKMYGRMAESRPVFRELEGLFRLMAAAKLVRDRFPESESRGVFPAFFGRYKLESGGAPDQVPGIPDMQHFDHARNTPMGMEIERFWLPSCGGISVAVEPGKAWVRRMRDARLSAFRNSVIGGRSSDSAWYWDVPHLQNGYWDVLRERMRLQELGQRFPNLAFFRLRRGGEDRKTLELLDEDDHVLKAGAAQDVLGEVAHRADARKLRSVFLEWNQWPADQSLAFREAILALAKQRKASWTAVPVSDRPGWMHPDNPLFNPASDWEQGEPPLHVVDAGPYKGWHRVTFRFLTASGGKTVPATLHVMVKSADVAARLQEESARDFRTKLFIAYSPFAALLLVVDEFRESLPEKDRKDLRIVEDEEGLLELS